MIRRLVSWLRRRPSGGQTGPPEGNTLAGIVHPGTYWFRVRGEGGVLRRGERLCPSCIYRRDSMGDIVEVIDCRTLNHHKWKGE